MTLKELYQVSPQAFTFIVERDAELNKTSIREYNGSGPDGEREVTRITPASYPMYKQVLEVELEQATEQATARPFTVADLLKQSICVDVYDDVCEALAIAFCGPQELTPEGAEHFAEVLDYEIEIYGENACVCVDAPEDKVWKRKLRKAREFFESAAGYCADSDYKKWFEED